MERLRLRQAVIVEGKYDKIRLESVLDALILPIGGFRVYQNREQRALIRTLAQTRGVIILTDSDSAGFRLRGHLSGVIGDGEVIHVYIPDVFGKERRKRERSAEGKLGVEGMDAATLREAFRRAGVLEEDAPPCPDPITRQDFYEDGLSGGPNSTALRRALFARLGLPARLSASAAPRLVSQLVSREEYKKLVRELRSASL